MSQNYAVIMAGGSGTRFWPESRVNNPKQFLDITSSGKSLIQSTFDRLTGLIPAENIFVVAFKEYTSLILENLPAMPAENVIEEPYKRNTAACVLLSSLIIQKMKSEGVVIFCPADHHIADEAAYTIALKKSIDFARTGNHIVTLGIIPSRPATTYGYIHSTTEFQDGFRQVDEFVEKPDLDTAKEYIKSENYAWNAGIFVWSTETINRSFQLNAPAIYEQLKGIPDGEDIENCYKDVESISVDYAIMEKAKNIYVLPSEFGWSDVGTWNSLYELLAGKGENVLLDGSLLEYNSSGCLVKTRKDKLVVCKDLKDFIIIDMEDTLLIFPREQEAEIKMVVKDIQTRYRHLS